MICKLIAAAVMMGISAGAVAQPAAARMPISSSARPTTARAAVLANIIGRVQMDSLIDRIVATDTSVVATPAAPVAYADATRVKVRNRG